MVLISINVLQGNAVRDSSRMYSIQYSYYQDSRVKNRDHKQEIFSYVCSKHQAPEALNCLLLANVFFFVDLVAKF